MAEYVVAIELGSSKITGVAGKKNLDGSITVSAVVQEDASQCIRKGYVNNIDRTAQCLTGIVNKLKKQLRYEITQVYVGIGGQSIRSVRNVIVKDLPNETIITGSMVDGLMDANRNMSYPEMEILYVATQEYKVDKQIAIDPIGMKASHLEGNYLNILGRNSFYNNLNISFDKAGINIAELYLAPVALADSVLTDAEKRGGCALVDLGADTTTVIVYHKNFIRHIAVIPLGGNSITRDLTSLLIDEKDAERMKLKYASAYTDLNDIDSSMRYSVDPEQSVESRTFIDIVEARIEEIVENVAVQIPKEYNDKLLNGFVLTGGGANMKNIERAFRTYAQAEKVRVAKTITQPVSSSHMEINAKNGRMNTVLGLIAKADMNCVGAPYNPTELPFAQDNSMLNSRTAKSEQPGVVKTQAEKEKEELERRRREEEERLREEEEERQRMAREEEERRIRRENSTWGKLKRKLKGFGNSILEPDE